jgi:hypothetical protein
MAERIFIEDGEVKMSEYQRNYRKTHGIEQRKKYMHDYRLAHKKEKPIKEPRVTPYKIPKKKFDSAENLYCVVTVGERWNPNKLSFALQHLTNKGYKAEYCKINSKWYIIREFRKDVPVLDIKGIPKLDSDSKPITINELTDQQFMQTYGEIIEEKENKYFFNTQFREEIKNECSN